MRYVHHRVAVYGALPSTLTAEWQCTERRPVRSSPRNNKIPAEYSDALNSFISDPMLLVMVAIGVALAIVGGVIGRKVLLRHFIRAGLVGE